MTNGESTLNEQFQGSYFDAVKEPQPVSFTPPEGACKVCARSTASWNDTDICNTCRRKLDNTEVLDSPYT